MGGYVANTKCKGALNSSRHCFPFKAILINILCSFLGGALLFIATETQLLDKVILAKWAALLIGICLVIYVILPWILVGIIYLTLSKMGRAESFIRKYFLRRYPQSHYLRTMFDASYHRETVLAATAFVWSTHYPNHLLWVKHRTHRRWLPPGGRLLANELPHEAIMDKVSSETGIPIKMLSFCKLFHKIDNDYIAEGENIEPAPIPLKIQKEIMEQRDGIPYHYDFIYVLEANYNGIPRGDQFPTWLTQDKIEALNQAEKPFPNVVFLSKVVLDKVAKASNSSQEDTV